MFPPAVVLPSSVAGFLALHWGLQALGEPSIQPGPVALTWGMLLGALTLFGLQLLLRVYDELKDAETDMRLGRAGDPRYVDRPLVTGRVLVEDLQALRDGVTWALLAANALLGLLVGPLALAAFLFAYGLCWLSSRWFFWPAISRNLLLAFVTHNPLTLALGLYVVALYAAELPGHRPLDGWTALLLLGLWLPMAAWELGRKVRLPEEETDYQTYSKLLGWRVAAALPALCVGGSALSLSLVLAHLDLGWIGPALLAAGAALPIGAVTALQVAPQPGRTHLRPWLEGFVLLVNVGLTALWAGAYGVGLGG